MDRYELISRVADDLAHELKNPLNAIVINLEVLRSRVRAGAVEGALERAAVIEAEVQRLHTLLEHLLRLLRPERTDATSFEIDAALADVGALAGLQAKRVRKELVLQPMGGGVKAQSRPETFRFVLLALVEDALLAVPEREGRVSVESVCDDRVASVRVRVEPAGSFPTAGVLADVRAALQGGAVELYVEPNHGSTVVALRLPLECGAA